MNFFVKVSSTRTEMSFLTKVATVTCQVAVIHCSRLCSHRDVNSFLLAQQQTFTVKCKKKTKYFSTMFQDLRTHPTPDPNFVDCCMVSQQCVSHQLLSKLLCAAVFPGILICCLFSIIIIILLRLMGFRRSVTSHYFNLLTQHYMYPVPQANIIKYAMRMDILLALQNVTMNIIMTTIRMI